jgi:peptide deformylase
MMDCRSIVVVPHTALATRAEEILDIDDQIRTLAEEMAQAMYRAPGIGLAANQVGELVRLIVLDLQYAYAEPSEKKKNPIFIINPKICLVEGKAMREEGCLSVPEFGIDIERHECVSVKGVDLDGNPLKIEADGLLARALQHEIDHLNGVTLLDYASPLKRNLYRRKLKKLNRRDR